jgi:hypothetical protein
MKIKSPKDFWAGLMFIAFGLFFLFTARDYEMGNTMHMGPAYFPSMLGGLTAVLGAMVCFQAFVVQGSKVPAISVRPLFFIALSLCLFGYLLKSIGLVFALALLVVVSAFAGYEFKIKEVLILSATMTIFSVLVFVKALGLPFPLWPGFLG